MRQGREIEILSNQNGVVRFRIPETGQEMTLPAAMDPARVDALIDGHIRAVQRGPQAQGPDSRSAGMVASDQAANVLKGIPQAVTGLPGAAVGVGQFIIDALRGKGVNRVQEMAQGAAEAVPQLADPSSPVWEQAAQAAGANLGGVALGGMAGRAANAIPSAARASGQFEQIMGQAKNVPLNLQAADAVAARATELSQHGSSMPKVLKDFIKNRQAGVPMTYAEGRDFASNAGALSAKEATKLNKKMHRQTSQFAKAMKEANREAAESVGLGDMYDQAMKEYGRAASLTEAAEILKKWGGRVAAAAALGAAGGAAARELYNR